MAKRNPFAAIAHGHDLAEAIVDAIREPLLVLDPDLRVIAASRSFYRTFAVTPLKTEGRLVFDLGEGQWNIPGLRVLLEDIIPKRRTVDAYEVEHEFPAIGRRVMLLNARRVFDEDGAASAILLAIEDVTGVARPIKKRTICFKQRKFCCRRCSTALPTASRLSPASFCSRLGPCNRRRRVGTSKRPTSASCRWQRCKQQLHASGLNERIEIGPYLTKLCASLAASMVGERRALSIKVQASSGGAVSSDAVSLGLIVTELVINALKHGFSDGAEGEILVGYDAQIPAGGFRFLTMDRDRRMQAARPRISALARASSRPWRINSMPRSRRRVERRVPWSQLLPPQSARGRNAQVLFPLWVISGHADKSVPCPLNPR